MELIANLLKKISKDNKIPTKMPIGAVDKIKQGILPIMNTSKLLLKNNELCHYVECAVLLTEKIVKHKVGTSSGFNFRICKGITYRVGRFNGVPIEEKIEEQTKGILYITNKRIVFIANDNSFDKNHRYLTAVEGFNNGIRLQYGNKKMVLLLADGTIAERVMLLLKQNLN